MKPSLPLVVALAAALTLSACGKMQDKAAEALAEKALEASGSKNVDIDVQDDGQTVTIQTDQGTIQQSSGDNVVLPADFPTDVVLPENYKVVSLMTMGSVTSVVMETPQSASAVFAAFKSGQAAQGWKETLSMQGADGSMLGFEKDERSLLVNVGSSDGGVATVSMSLQSKQP